MRTLSHTILVLLAAAIAPTAYGQCFSCAIPQSVPAATINDLCDVLQASDLQRDTVNSIYTRYQDDWKSLQDSEVAALAKQEITGAHHQSDLATYAAHVRGLIRQNRAVLKSLEAADQALFDDVADALSDDQVALLPAWLYMEQARARAALISGRGHQFDLLKLLPGVNDDAEERRRCIEAILPSLKAQANRLRTLRSEMMKEIDGLYSDAQRDVLNPNDLAAQVQSTLAQANADRATLSNELATDVQRSLEDVAPRTANMMVLRLKLADSAAHDDAAVQTMLNWMASIDAAAISPDVAERCKEIVMDHNRAADSWMQDILAQGAGTDAFDKAAAKLSTVDTDIHAAIFAAIPYADYLQVIGPCSPGDQQHAEMPTSEPHRPEVKGMDLHPMTAARFQTLLRILNIPSQCEACSSAYESYARRSADDDVIQAAFPATPIRPHTTVPEWLNAKSRGLQRADELDFRLIDALAVHSTPSRANLATAQARTWRRQCIPDQVTADLLMPQFGHTDIVVAACEAGLNLDGPTLAELLLWHATNIESKLAKHGEITICLHWSISSAAGNIHGEAGTPLEITERFRENKRLALQELHEAINSAESDITASIPDDEAGAWQHSIVKAMWPRITRDIEVARTSHRSLVAAMPPPIRAQLERSFADLLTDALALQDETVSLLLNQSIHPEHMTLLGDARIELQAVLDRQAQRVDQWREEANDIVSSSEVLAVHPSELH